MMLEILVLAALAGESDEIDRLVVRGRNIAPEAPQSTATVSEEEIENIRPTHPAELFSRLPGSWVTRGSGQEHLTAIRSPILSGAGGCGALLILETGIPIRPPGFCNVNNLFEVNLDQAGSVSVLRGPGGLGHASGGLHGVIDITPRMLSPRADDRLRLEAGSHDYYRASGRLTSEVADGRIGADFSATDAGSFRVDEQYEHQLGTLQYVVPIERGQWRTLLSGARLDQDTAGYILGYRAYADPDLRRQNLNPEAFRRASALRLISQAEWIGADGVEHRFSGFARRSRMTFLQHFLPGKPLERNGQVSAGVQYDRDDPARGLAWGVDAELFRGDLSQVQDGPASDVPPPVAGIRPAGKHYDYVVDGRRLGGYLARTFDLADDWQFRAGVHADWIRYDYDNRMRTGNLAEDGTACDFGGCLYNRPADRSDEFLELAPELTLSRRFDNGQAWLRLARGFRAPQATELYRLQRGQDVANLDPERLDAIEVGVRSQAPFDWELVAYYQRKRNYIFRDGEGFNVSDGKSGHRGIEFSLRFPVTDHLDFGARGSYAIHRYRFSRDLGGETIVQGNDMPAAPRRMASADLNWNAGHRLDFQFAAEFTGRYWLDAANRRGHSSMTLLHFSSRYDLPGGWRLGLRVRNLLDRRYAERADFAFGNYRYFPGAGRTAYATLAIAW
ncbi:TonB-dependent receptor [Wenzhouxiangella sp. XN201]|uniref:TonB-dependent receptor n=1 Tax=Wenzhouxiangella sp. XN201 TaxID=2710755 RepID=UPI0013C66CC4|nr:TonB-dependent receptor [Wenzhouxiangella sp. XN201]NEZ03213.1 TonB-dependent receptor [Wenzhouxiangella sp. XN201]